MFGPMTQEGFFGAVLGVPSPASVELVETLYQKVQVDHEEHSTTMDFCPAGKQPIQGVLTYSPI